MRHRSWVSVVALVTGVLLPAGCGASPPAVPTATTTSPALTAAAPTIAVSPAVSAAADPATPITVEARGGRLTSVVVTGGPGPASSATTVAGVAGPDATSWRSTAPLAYGRTYQVLADAVSASGTPSHESTTVTTIAPRHQSDVSFVPLDGADVGVGQPVSVRFTRAPTDRAAAVRALSVTSSPAQPGAWHWISATQVDYRPQLYWQPGTTVSVHAATYGVDLGAGTYGAPDQTRTMHVHDAWIARADGRAEQMQIFDDGALVKTMNISLGSPDNPTHVGAHVISDKQPSIVMDSSTYGVGPGRPGYYRETVNDDERISNDGEFVHAAPWSVGQQGSDNVSHGCVNLSPADAGWFFGHFGVGDVVEVTNSGGPPLPLYDTWGDWELPWTQWQASA